MARKKKAKIIPLQKKLSPKNYIIKVARKLAIHEVRISGDFKEIGLSIAIVSRQKKNGDLVVGTYKLDAFCLGLVDTEYHILEEHEYLNTIEYMVSLQMEGMPVIDPNFGFNYIYGVAKYGESNGFKAHKNFAITQYLLDDKDDIDFEDIEFGKDGRPFYAMPDPYNHERNIAILNKTVGYGNYDIMTEEDFEDDDFEGEYLDDDSETMQFDLTVKEYVDLTLTKEEEQSYKAYTSCLTLLDEVYADKKEQLKNEYLKNPSIVITSINAHSEKKYGIEPIPLEKSLAFWPSLIESYLIHGGDEFIYLEEVINCFSYDPSDYLHIELAVFYHLLHVSGPDKFKHVLPLIADLYCDNIETVEDVKNQLQSIIKMSFEDHIRLEDEYGDEYIHVLIFNYLGLYQRVLGEISFDGIDWDDFF